MALLKNTGSKNSIAALIFASLLCSRLWQLQSDLYRREAAA
jgi:hypothetical protein